MTDPKTPRTVAEIQADIAENDRRYEELRRYFGSHLMIDIGGRLASQGLYRQLEALRAELREARDLEA